MAQFTRSDKFFAARGVKRIYSNGPPPEYMLMSKIQRSNKESKKQAQLSPKEKKAAKREKKQSTGHTPFIVKN